MAGLHNLPRLEELHISGQRLPPPSEDGMGGGLYFDTRSMLAVSPTLRILNAVDCGITDESAAALPPLPALRKLDLSGNCMEIAECLELVLGSAQRLTTADLRGNPFCKNGAHSGAGATGQRYRDSIILMSDSLEELDGETVSGQQRQFLLRLQISKLKRQVGQDDSGSDELMATSGRPPRHQEATDLATSSRHSTMPIPARASPVASPVMGGSRGRQQQQRPKPSQGGAAGRRSPSLNDTSPVISLGMEGLRIN